jgi:hypothetical protein
MSLLRQVALLPAGCQAWSKNVLEASSSHFFSAATLAVYAHSLEDAPLYSLQKVRRAASRDTGMRSLSLRTRCLSSN